MVESAGNAPASACLQGKCITCLPRPLEIGRPPRCCPEQTEFWRLCRAGWRTAFRKLVRLPGVAPGHAPWHGAILAVKSQPRKLKGPEASLHFRPMPFQQRTNTSCYLAIPTHGFTVVLSVFRGTPPPKPLDCKIRPDSFGALVRDRLAEPSGGEPRLSRPSSVANAGRTNASL
jgi:hypothetical protein